MNATFGTCIVQRTSLKHIHNYALKLLCMFCLTALLEYMTALLEYIGLFVIDVHDLLHL